MSSSTTSASKITARTQFLQVRNATYGYRRFGGGAQLVVNGIHDEMIPVSNAYALGEHLSNAVLLMYPDCEHGSSFQFHQSFTRQAAAFLASDSPFAPYWR